MIYIFHQGGWDQEWALIRASSKEQACAVAKLKGVYCLPEQLREVPVDGDAEVIWHLESPGPVSS